MNTQKNESLFLTKDISRKYKCKFDCRRCMCNSSQNWNNDKCWCECKKHHISEKDDIWILLHVAPKMVNIYKTVYLSIIDNSVITCDEFIDAEAKTIAKKFIEKNISCKTQNFYTLHAFY